MPASYTHQCIARDAAASLGLFAGEQLRAALTAGSEGPDPFFFSLIPVPGAPSAPKLGSLMHTKKTGDFLIALLKACARSEITRAYACGFIAHYAADTTFHPFVYAHSRDDQGVYSGTVHCTLEHGLETLLYRRRGHSSGVPQQMAGYIRLTKENKDEIARALSDALDTVYPEHRLGYPRVRRSFEDASFFCTLLRSPSGRRYRAFGALAAVAGLDKALHAHMMPAQPPKTDIANDAHAPWASPWEPQKTRTESFDELYCAAVARAKALIPAALSFMMGELEEETLRRIAGDNSFDSGLPWQETRSVHDLA